jgi:(R,R)-butanediol dehydrogenase / meso-butanediol dehydrogenase / diacetyl reductase
MRALAWPGGDGAALREVDPPQARPGWLLVDVAYCGLCGTDLHICAGEHPRAQPGIVLGHEMSGRIASNDGALARGTNVVINPLLPCGVCDTCRAGQPHTCRNLRLIGIDEAGGAAERVAVPETNVVPVDGDIDLRRLAFAEPLAVAVRAVRRAGLKLGERVLVVGGGPIGLAVAACARLAGAASVVVVEPSAARRAVAAELAFDVAEDPAGASADVVFDAAAHPAVAARWAEPLGPGGRVVVVGVYGKPTPVDLQAATFKELTIVGTRVYSNADVDAAIDLIVSGRFDPEPLLTRDLPLDDAADAVPLLREGRELKVLLEVAP